MQSSAQGDTVVETDRLSALVARSEINIRHSRALVAVAEALVRTTRRIRRPKIAGGTDGPDAAPPVVVGTLRALRTWARLRDGALPTTGVRRRWVGPGRGERCNGCDDRIGSYESEFEVDFRNALLLRFHEDCFKVWQSFDGKRPRP